MRPANLMYYALVIMRKQNRFVHIRSGSCSLFFLSGGLVGAFGINGAALSVSAADSGETAGFGFCTVKILQERGKGDKTMTEERKKNALRKPRVDVVIPTYKPGKEIFQTF